MSDDLINMDIKTDNGIKTINDNTTFTMFDSVSMAKSQKDLELKIDWFVHVLDSLEKLADKYSELTDKVYSNEASATDDLIVLREYIYTELKHLRSEFSACKDTCHGAFDNVKTNLDAKVEKVAVRIDYEKTRIEDKILTNFNDKIEKLNIKVDKMNDTVVSVRVKMATIGTLGGLVGSVFLFLIQLISKKYF